MNGKNADCRNHYMTSGGLGLMLPMLESSGTAGRAKQVHSRGKASGAGRRLRGLLATLALGAGA